MNCSWDLVPRNKQELVAMYRAKQVVPHPTERHVSKGRVCDVEYHQHQQLDVDAESTSGVLSSRSRNGAVRKRDRDEMCRYAVMRRSAMNPIFHPYFINYGYNKEELLNRLISLSISSFPPSLSLEYNYYVFLSEFCVEIPHFRTLMSKSYNKTDPMWYLAHLIRVTYGINLVWPLCSTNTPNIHTVTAPFDPAAASPPCPSCPTPLRPSSRSQKPRPPAPSSSPSPNPSRGCAPANTRTCRTAPRTYRTPSGATAYRPGTPRRRWSGRRPSRYRRYCGSTGRSD